MKKVLSLFLAAILILCVVPAVFAANEPTAKIEGHNLIVADNVYIAYMVKVSGSPDEVGLLVWNESKSSYTYGNKQYEATQTQHSGNTYVFKFTDIAAKQMADDFYAVPYAKKGGNYYYGKLDKYSILQYAYNKMGKTGTSGTADKNLLSLLDGMLAYGESCQKFFTYNMDKPARGMYYQIKTVGAKLPDGTTSGLYKSGESVTLTANAETNWYDELGKKLGTGTTLEVTPTNNTVITATNTAPAQKAAVTINKTASADTVAAGGTVAINFAITNNSAEMKTVSLKETLTNATMLTTELTAGTAKNYYIPAGATVNVTYGLTATATGAITAATTATCKPTHRTESATPITVDTTNITCTSGTLTDKKVFVFGDYTTFSAEPLLAAMATEKGYKLNLVATASNTPAGVQNSYNIQELFTFSGNTVTGFSSYGAKLEDALEGSDKCDFVIPTGANWTLADAENRQPKARAAIKFISNTLKERNNGETLYLLVSPAYDDGYDFSAKIEGTTIFGGFLTDIKTYAAHADLIQSEAQAIKKTLGSVDNVKFIKAGYAYTDVKDSVALYNNDIVGNNKYTDADKSTVTAYTVVNKYRFPNINGQYLIAACISKALFGNVSNISQMGLANAAKILEAVDAQEVNFDPNPTEEREPSVYESSDDVEMAWDEAE